MARALFKHPVKFLKINFIQDESGSMIKQDGDYIFTKARIVSNSKNRDNQNGDINYLASKTIDINGYINLTGYEEFELCKKRYRILNVSSNEDWNIKTITAEEIND